MANIAGGRRRLARVASAGLVVGVTSMTALLVTSAPAVAAPASTELVSISTGGTQGNDESDTFTPFGTSDDGRFVAFVSSATTLVAGDTNGVDDVFVRDRQSGATERMSVATGGTQGNGASRALAISGDGRYVVFNSSATNLVAGTPTPSSTVSCAIGSRPPPPPTATSASRRDCCRHSDSTPLRQPPPSPKERP
ncbi:MAG: hypothetical protein WBA97_28045 [Actinophytocola sp.]|uniref:hypothetical protein n=1 Tax=Actinophytocola sp. TaxID=1872138 RepID=UPI003C74F4CA